MFVDEAKVYAYVWGGVYGAGQWVECTRVDGTHISFTIDGTATGCKIVRFKSTVAEPNWEASNIHNQTGDIALDNTHLAFDYQIGD